MIDINLILSEEDVDLVIEGLEALKSKDLAGELMEGMFEVMVTPQKMSKEDRRRWEEVKRKRKIEKELKEKERKELARKIDVVKSKIILMREQLNNAQAKETRKTNGGN